MTDRQKNEIVRMRQNGAKYSKISDVLGISINTVKSYCRRNKVQLKETKTGSGNFCKNCGKNIIQREKVKKRKFCCPECKTEWWNSHPEAVNRKANYELRCLSCGKGFVSYGNKGRKYCSHECYINARFKDLTIDKTI